MGGTAAKATCGQCRRASDSGEDGLGTQPGSDPKRFAFRRDGLQRFGWRVLRLDAELVLRDLPAAVAAVREVL